MIKKQSGRYGSIAKPIGALGIVLLAALSLAVLAYVDGRMGPSTASAQEMDDDALTRAYVDRAIEYYMDRGLSKTVERYGNPLSWDNWSYLIVADAGTHVLVSSPLIYLNGKGIEALAPGDQLGDEIESATQQGHWFDGAGLNMFTGDQEEARYYITVRDGLAFMSPRFANVPTPAPRPAAEPDDDALTTAYVMKAIERYESEGREATVAYYNSRESVEGQRFMTIIDANTNILLTSPLRPAAVGVTVPATATEEGIWIERQGNNPVTNQREPRRTFFILRDGLIFAASHSALRENIAQATKNYVAKATELYDSEGLDATIAYFDSRESVDGQFYLFLIGADDIYLAHPIFPHLKGTDIKDVVGSDGQELGREIAQATEEGIWVEYLWPNPVTGLEDSKVTWAIRHDGLIFASGYYTGEADAAPPPWRDADPREYTVDYVNRAVERYERDGLEALKAYYNSVAAFEGQWYLFATDANDIYHIHPLLPRLIGTDIKDVVGADGYELGKEIAKATEEGHWIEYIWPHPSTLKNAPKVSYAVRRDGMIFASGYYPEPEDPAAFTKNYVQKAIDYYDENGLDATVAHYNSEDSFEGQWYLGLADSDSRILVSAVVPHVIGSPLNPEAVRAIDAGQWAEIEWFGNLTAANTFRHIWGTRHDGLYFYSGYFAEQGTPLPDTGN